MAEESLKNKTVSGVGWSAAEAFLGQGVTFSVGLVLARLLSPEEYGLIGIVTIFTTVLLGFVDCGFGNALIRKQDANDDDYYTMFIVNLGMSIFTYALLFIGAPYIAKFFDRPQLVELVRVTGLLLIIQALSIVQNTILSKKIDFKTKTKASVTSAVASGVVGIGMAFAGFGVWSFVGQQITRQLIYTISLWFLNRWWPKLKFSVDSLRYMWGFGWKIMVSGFLDRLWKQLNQFVVGKCYDPATLGQYSRANEYASIFSSNITSIVQRVSYPVLSQVQDNEERMVAAYRKVIKTTMFVTAICMISMAAIAEPMIYCLIGPQWHEAALYLPFICMYMSLYPLHAINLNMLQVLGRSDIYLKLEIIKKVLALGPLALGIFINIFWMLIGCIILDIVSFFLNSYYTGKRLNYTSWMQIKDVAPSYGIAFLIALSLYFFKYLPVSYWAILPIQIVTGAIVFYLVCERTHLEEYLEIRAVTIKLIQKITRK